MAKVKRKGEIAGTRAQLAVALQHEREQHRLSREAANMREQQLRKDIMGLKEQLQNRGTQQMTDMLNAFGRGWEALSHALMAVSHQL